MAKSPQLTDEQGNKVPSAHLYVFSRTLDEIQAEQNRIRDAEGDGKPNAAIVVERMLGAYRESLESGLDAEDRNLVSKLIAMLQDPKGNPSLETIRQILERYEPNAKPTEITATARTPRKSVVA